MTGVALTAAQQSAVQRRTVFVLSLGQVLGGIAFGATVSLGALLAADISGSDALSGLATASVTLGAAMCAIPLARLAARVGRRPALADVSALVGITIALHVGGMYALSPLFGVLADRWGRLRVVLLGQVLLAAALAFAIFVGTEQWGVIVALILLGLGWSAATVAGAALLTEASAPEVRTRRQGRSDSLMSLSAAAGSVLAGVVLSNFQYAGLGVAASVLVLAIVVLSPLGRIRPQ
ncbi:MFS transporter [Microbacterium sp. SA39]|uniref:MFS transporter n=1 Tax=Microbacterium sp. SA39 TaxID=1263625 RepID=UPI0005FA0591|nr:MFS transporter [Microbacterium sp. SA39]KJQ53021.1 Major Facilitator Superfamily protein [Microbacterium sp. SA39]